MFPVLVENKRCYINEKGKIILKTDYSGYTPFYEDMASVKIDNRFGFIDKRGEIAIDPIYDEVRDFCEGFCAIRTDDLWGFIDKKGKMRIEPQFYEAGDFSEGLVGVIPTDDYEEISYINKSGKIIIKDSGKANIHKFSDGLLPCIDKKSKLAGYRDKKGEWRIKPQYYLNHEFSEGLAGVETTEDDDEKTQFINKKGEIVIPPLYITVHPIFTEGIAIVKKKTKKGDYRSGCINTDGELVVPFEFYSIENFSCGLAAVKLEKNGKTGFINKKGWLAIPPKYDMVLFGFNDDMVIVVEKGRQFYINTKGDIIWEFKFNK